MKYEVCRQYLNFNVTEVLTLALSVICQPCRRGVVSRIFVGNKFRSVFFPPRKYEIFVNALVLQ